VSAVRFFPKFAHLLLSSGLDGTVKIWNVNGNREKLRTFVGHKKAVRDINFNHDGSRFISAAYDKKIQFWDTETGQSISTFGNGKVPLCCVFNPQVSKNHIFLTGCTDRRIYQWDTRSKKISQIYDQHLGAVNTVTFIEGSQKFISSSDDKSLRMWDFGIPVVVKYISDPTMFSMPSVCLDPTGKWLAAQSLDNNIFVYAVQGGFRRLQKKKFEGHEISGYACQVSFSPDGKILTSGDAFGNVNFWDWDTSKLIRTLKAHEGVCIGATWHPLETSKLVTCGWDGKIHMFT